ncbi:hypothetical protein L218DRAFT_978073 [Marasmius fiardii PR-910]|nr:hypothetical protein L218DRAFT_978073 [Marasmius fiardii PR-910]
MPRRPSKKNRNKNVRRNESKWNSIEDIPLDEEEQFHASRDRILLDGEHGEDEDMDEDEVFALKGIPEDDDDDYEDEPMSIDTPLQKQHPPSKKQKKIHNEEESSGEETWGKGKSAYYASNDAEIDSDDEETIALELQEAKRLQSKSREPMSDADFGLEDLNFTKEEDPISGSSKPEPLPEDKSSVIRYLEKTDPLSLALARDWSDTANNLSVAKARLEALEKADPTSDSLGIVHLHYQTLLTYATTLAFYLYLRSERQYALKPELLNSHPVMKRLVVLKQSLVTLEDLVFTVEGSEDNEDLYDEDEEEESDLEEGEEEGMDYEEMLRDAKLLWQNEYGEEDDDDEFLPLSSKSKRKDRKAKSKTFIPTADDDLDSDVGASLSVPEPPKKKRKILNGTTSTATTITKPEFDLIEPVFSTSEPPSSRVGNTGVDISAYGDPTSLHTSDSLDKSQRKKGLRFHTSRIESTSAKREGARNQAMGGDDDVPYRERSKRILTVAKGKGKRDLGMDLDDKEPDSRPQDAIEEGEDGYYDLVAKASKERKVKKREEYERERGERLAQLEEATDDPDGPRGLTRSILTNKGLTPRRAKANRNPRVKKKQKFVKAQRKVASQRAVYKGGLGETKGVYVGEKTGVSRVVKSVRLG